jgi:hypothetical protein
MGGSVGEEKPIADEKPLGDLAELAPGPKDTAEAAETDFKIPAIGAVSALHLLVTLPDLRRRSSQLAAACVPSHSLFDPVSAGDPSDAAVSVQTGKGAAGVPVPVQACTADGSAHAPSKGCCVGASSRSDSSYSDSEDGSEDVRVCSEGWNPSKRGDGAASDPQR